MKTADWFNTWAQDYIANVKPATVVSYKIHIRVNIIPYIGKVELTSLSAPMIQRMYNKLQNEKGLSAKTLKNVHGVVHRALNQAKKLNLINSNPSDAVVLPRIEKKSRLSLWRMTI